jgi:hypothetical protein
VEVAKLVVEYLRVLIWPAVAIIICLVFRRHVINLLNRIRHAELPGGVAVDLDQEIREVKALSVQIQEKPPSPDKKQGRPAIPLTEANARMIQLGLRPSPSGLDMSYYRNLAERDPNVALAGLRIEIDIMAGNLAKGFHVLMSDRDYGGRLIRKLYDSGALTSEQMQLTMKVLKVCNAAVHGTSLSREEADDVINSAEVLSDQYLIWLSWGFDDGWKPRAERGTS